jgi:hypothetical protein
MHRTFARFAVVAGALALAAPAIAYVCHPDPAGTRSLSLHGRVVAYSLHGSRLTIALRTGDTCRTLSWRADLGRVVGAHAACGAVASAASRQVALTSRVRAISPGGADRPYRLNVLASGRVVHSWAMPVGVLSSTLQVSGGLAAFIARGGSGLWVTRLADGRTTLVGPVRAGDRPLLDESGVAYEDNVYKRAPAARPLLKFLPTRGIRHELAQVGRALHTGGAIRAFSADGTRVALVVAGAAGQCDRVVFWNIAWRSVEQVSEQNGSTCGALGASRRISNIALGGPRAEWVTLQDGRPVLVAADDIGCQEWVIRRLSDPGPRLSLAGIAAHGTTLAFALVHRSDGRVVSQVGRVSPAYRNQDAFRLRTVVRAVSADSGRIAVLAGDRSIDVRSRSGKLIRAVTASGATAIALRRNRLVTTRDGRLDVYSVHTGARLHSWPLPAGAAAHVDLQYGIAVVTAGRAIYAIDVSSGRRAQLAVAPVAARAQIEPIGVVYTYSIGDRGTAMLVPINRVESALR